MTFIEYCRSLKPEDWSKMVNSKWTVKDVIAHLVGWERGDVEAIKTAWETKKLPWWKINKNYDDFNKKWVEFYKNYTPEELIEEWEMWQEKIKKEIDRIGYQNLKSRPDLFDWLLENEKGKNIFTLIDGGSHYEQHYKQIKKALGNN